jgi:3-methyladenine DNA glycosylase AlkD
MFAAMGTAGTVGTTLRWLERRGSRRNREGMARYGISSPKMFGVPVGALQTLAKRLGPDHRLAQALWKTGWFEARMLAVFVEEPARVTPAQMDRWAGAFDNWAICDTVCFHLFDRVPHAWPKVTQWARRREEFVKRAAFALLAALALHDRAATDRRFLARFGLIERAARDGRNYVRKGVSWALRSIGYRNPELHRAAVGLGEKLAASSDRSAAWVGRDTLRDLNRPLVKRRVARKTARTLSLPPAGPPSD